MRASYLVGSLHHRGIHSTFSNFEVSYGNATTPDTLAFIVWAVCRFDPVGFANASEQYPVTPGQSRGAGSHPAPLVPSLFMSPQWPALPWASRASSALPVRSRQYRPERHSQNTTGDEGPE